MNIFKQHHNQMMKRQQGAVSLFIVIFAAMLMTILTVSFVRIMTHEQLQATNNDLSQSAYDSALAGVEDAKRALVACQSGDTRVCDVIDKKSCMSLYDAGVVPVKSTSDGNQEMPVQTLKTDDTDAQLDQAYTCVKVSRVTDDYVGQLSGGQSKVVPLKGVSEFDTVQLSWFQYDDFKSTKASSDQALSYFSSTSACAPYCLPSMTSGSWPQNSPPLMRAQVMQYDGTAGFSLDDLNSGTNASTMFLYPLGGSPTEASYDFTAVGRRQQTAPYPVYCAKQLSAGGYACTAKLKLPSLGKDADPNRVAYLRLTSLYNQTHYQITLFNNGSSPVQINGEQPIVDSTARANDVFRRVESRVEMASDFPYPDAAVDVTGSLCKNFVVTNDPAVAASSNQCTP